MLSPSFPQNPALPFQWLFQVRLFQRLCLRLWLIQDSNWKGRVLWKLFGGLATILQNWISWNEQKMREAHITRRGTSFYLLIFIEKIINRKIEHSLSKYRITAHRAFWNGKTRKNIERLRTMKEALPRCQEATASSSKITGGTAPSLMWAFAPHPQKFGCAIENG